MTQLTLDAPHAPVRARTGLWGGLGQDVRVAVRRLVRERGFTLTALLTLALATGATTAVFTLVNAVLLRSLGYRAPEELVRLYDVQADYPRASVSIPDARDWLARSHTLSGMALFETGSRTLGGDGEPTRVSTTAMSAGALRVLGLPPLLGREFAEDEAKRGGPAVAMLGERFWRKAYASRPDVVGTTLRLDGRDHLVVGVVREQPHWRNDNDVWLPLQPIPQADARGWHFLQAVARMKPGVALATAQKDLEQVQAGIVEENPEAKGHGVLAVPWTEELLGGARTSLGALGAVVALVLLIACVNLANLLLARGAARRREVAVRMALGADRWIVARGLLVEAAVLSLVGTSLGVLLGALGSPVLRDVLALRTAGLSGSLGLDGRVLLFCAGLCIVTTALFGVLPSLLLSRGDLAAARGEMRTSLGRGTGWLQSALVVLEVALALAPLLGAGLVLRSVQRLLAEDPGFRPEHAIAFRMQLPRERYADDPSRAVVVRQIVDRLRTLPGASSVGAVNDLPLSGSDSSGNFSIEGQAPFEKGHEPGIEFRVATGGYFESMGIALREGRYIEDGDRRGSEPVAVVNAEAVRRFFGGRSPLGARIRPGDGTDNPDPWRRIVGVVGDVRHSGLGEKPRPELYIPFDQDGTDRVTFVIRSRSALAPLAEAARREVAAVDSGLALYDPRTLEARVADSVAAPRAAGLLLTAFAVLAVLLAAAGVYGVLAFGVAQKTREIGIRMAIGASAGSIRWWVLRRALTLGGIGIVAGLGGALLLGRLLQGLLYGVAPSDPTTAFAAVVLLTLITVVAALVPARRATRIDPQEALRAE